MPIELPSPIRTYVAANARLDADGMLSAFADDAVVSDEARRHAG
ncbi:MAG: nuclear transport factor 2 family protein, partial [Phenylobacterium sp.]|nr:nuclear transport factor 2 family protein [Phenylobacterium sp.]